MCCGSLRVQVPEYKVSTQHHNYDSYYRNLKYPIAGDFGPLGVPLSAEP